MSLWQGGNTPGGGAKTLKFVEITTSGTWQVPSGADDEVLVDGCAAGSGGGGAFTSGAGGGAGSGGASCEKIPMRVVPGETLTATIGAGGVGGNSGATPTGGGIGGDTILTGSIDKVHIRNYTQSGGLASSITNGGNGGAGSRGLYPEGNYTNGGVGGVTNGNGAAGNSTPATKCLGMFYGAGSGSGGAGPTGLNSSVVGGGVFDTTGATNGAGLAGSGGVPGGSRWGKRRTSTMQFEGPLPYPNLLAGDRVTNFGYGMGGEGATSSAPTPTAGAGLPGFVRIWYRE